MSTSRCEDELVCWNKNIGFQPLIFYIKVHILELLLDFYVIAISIREAIPREKCSFF